MLSSADMEFHGSAVLIVSHGDPLQIFQAVLSGTKKITSFLEEVSDLQKKSLIAPSLLSGHRKFALNTGELRRLVWLLQFGSYTATGYITESYKSANYAWCGTKQSENQKNWNSNVEYNWQFFVTFVSWNCFMTLKNWILDFHMGVNNFTAWLRICSTLNWAFWNSIWL